MEDALAMDENIYDCIVVQMPTTIPIWSRPLATLSSRTLNSRQGNTVRPLNTFKPYHSTQTMPNFSAPRPAQIPQGKVRAPKCWNRSKVVSPTVVKLKASAEKEVQLVTLHGEDLVGRRRSRRVAEGPRMNYMESLEADNQPEEETDAATSHTSSSQPSTAKLTRHIQSNKNSQEYTSGIQEIQSLNLSKASTPRERPVRSCTFSPTASYFSSTPTTTRKRRAPKVRSADKYPPYLEQLLRDRVYDEEVGADNEMQVFKEEVRQRGWQVGGERLPPH